MESAEHVERDSEGAVTTCAFEPRGREFSSVVMDDNNGKLLVYKLRNEKGENRCKEKEEKRVDRRRGG